MGIGRDSRHKRRATGGRMPVHQKKRKFEMARTPANTKLGPKQVRSVRGRGGNYKYRALKIDNGNFTWGSEQITKRTRILDVVYNATNNELVRTKTVVKNAIVHIDGNPFKQYYSQHYDVELGKKKEVKVAEGADAAAATTEVKKKSRHALASAKRNQAGRVIDNHVAEQFKAGRILACITSRPGQSGRADGYILEGKELEFYVKKMEKRKK
jgi:small subunit ribosomal protein S8e